MAHDSRTDISEIIAKSADHGEGLVACPHYIRGLNAIGICIQLISFSIELEFSFNTHLPTLEVTCPVVWAVPIEDRITCPIAQSNSSSSNKYHLNRRTLRGRVITSLKAAERNAVGTSSIGARLVVSPLYANRSATRAAFRMLETTSLAW